MAKKPDKALLNMKKGWQCKNCKSTNLSTLHQLQREGKWIVEGKCEDCETIMRFTKHGSYIYALPKKKAEKLPF